MPDASAPFRRHELVWITPDAWDDALARQGEVGEISLVKNWASRGWPAIVRRRFETDPSDLLAIGAPLPPSLGKRRIALTVDPDSVLERRARAPLWQAASAAPAAWRKRVADVLTLAESTGIEPGVFGSLLWEHMTGLDYVRATSDLDLLWTAPAEGALRPLLATLAALDGADDDGAPRLDGEIIFADDIGVNWRELWKNLDEPDAQVIGKSLAHLRLIDVRAFIGEALV